MTAEEIIRRVRNHNALQWCLGLGLIPFSLLLWYISFWFFRLAFYLALRLFLDNAWTITYYLAWACLVPLLIEGLRRTRGVFDLSEYVRSGYYDNFLLQTDAGFAFSRHIGHPTAAAYLISQLLFSAPHMMVQSLRALNSRLPVHEAIARDAARILNELRASRKWTPAERYSNCGTSLFVLSRLSLIWTEDKSGEVEIRYPAGEP